MAKWKLPKNMKLRVLQNKGKDAYFSSRKSAYSAGRSNIGNKRTLHTFIKKGTGGKKKYVVAILTKK